jgi:hypothetical protein
MPRVGFDPTTAVLERAKTVHALDGAATVIGLSTIRIHKNSSSVRELRHEYKLMQRF